MPALLILSSLLFCFTASYADIPALLEPLEMKKPEEVSQIDKGLRVVGGVIEFPIYSFYFGSPSLDGRAYVPNIAVRMGPKFIYKKFGLRTTFSLSLPQREIDRRGDTEQKNFVFSFYWKGHAVDFYYQTFKGFYLGSPFVEVGGNRPNRYTQLPEARSENWGFNWYYNINPSGLSLSSAFDQAEFTIQDGAGWVMIPFFRHWSIDLGDTIIQGSDPGDIYAAPDLTGGTFDTFGSALAFAKTWALDSYFISTLVGLGPALQFQEYTEGSIEKDELTFAAKFNLNLSAGRKSSVYTYGLNMQLDSIYSRVASIDVYSSFLATEVFYNYRF